MKFKFLLITIFFTLAPFFTFAQVGGGTNPTPGGGTNPVPGGGTNPVSGDTSQVTVIDINIPNPISVGTIPEFIQKVLEFIITIGLPILAMAIIYSGFLFITAQGAEAQITKAKNALLFAVIGGFILLGSWLIAGAVKEALTDLLSMI